MRPDSGDIVQVTADTTEWLMDAFGYEVNSKGFKILPPFIRVVQGDGVNFYSLPQVYMELERRGLAADNAVFGMGGGLLQHWNRDTMNFGQKASAVCVNGEWRDISKQPTGASFKTSKKGRLALKYENGTYVTVPKGSIPESENVLRPVFRNGKLLKKWDFTELVANAEREVPESYYIDHIGQMRTVVNETAVTAPARSGADRGQSGPDPDAAAVHPPSCRGGVSSPHQERHLPMTHLHVFDMDGTLLRGAGSVELARHLGTFEAADGIERAWGRGEITDVQFWERMLRSGPTSPRRRSTRRSRRRRGSTVSGRCSPTSPPGGASTSR